MMFFINTFMNRVAQLAQGLLDFSARASMPLPWLGLCIVVFHEAVMLALASLHMKVSVIRASLPALSGLHTDESPSSAVTEAEA